MNAVSKFSSRDTVGVMKTEHSVFIPAEFISEQSDETEDFIKASRKIANTPDWKCEVTPEELTGKLVGIEFVFEFSEDTDYKSIISELETRVS